MTGRFGGKFSPDAAGPDSTPPDSGTRNAVRADPAGMMVNLLFAPAIPLVFLSITQGAIALSLALLIAALLTLAGWLTRDGLRAEAAWNARRVARRPALPRKIVASLLTGLGIAIAVFRNDLATIPAVTGAAMIAPLLYGLATGILHSVAFGIDPMRDKGMEGIDTFQQDRVARAVDEAETYLDAMTDAIRRAGDQRIEARVEQFQSTARALFRTVEEDPRDLSAARRYLSVYLRGARDATIRFADINAHTNDARARTDYAALLDDLEQNFAARTRAMLLDDRTDLTIEIEVLRERLQREGVRLD